MKRLFVVAAALIVFAGCSSVRNMLPTSSTSVGDQMLNQAKETSTLGKSWKEGQKLVEKGEKLKARSEKLARQSREAELEAESLIAKGENLIGNSESNYRVAFDAESEPATDGFGASTR